MDKRYQPKDAKFGSSERYRQKTCETILCRKVQRNFADASKAALLIDQLEKAFQSGVLPSYNKDGDWISIQTSRVSYKIPLDTPLPK
jgi:hypothetical protein